MAAQPHYEELYGIGFLDDLHNFFPAILYDASRFQTVQQVLTYIRAQARNRFDLFSFGERAYQDAQVRAATTSRGQTSVSMLFETTIPASSRVHIQPANANTVQSNFVNANHTVTHAEDDADDENEDDEEEQQSPQVAQSVTNNLDRLLAVALLDVLANGSSASPILSTGASSQRASYRIIQDPNYLASLLSGRENLLNIESLMQPVIVRPTQEQITAGSQILTLTETEPCSICQDSITVSQSARKLNVCQHVFHQECIDTWFNRNVHCPICRHDIREQEAQPRAQS